MRRLDLRTLDRRVVLGAGISLVSLLVMGIGLFAIVSALADDPVQLPSEGSIEDIIDEASPEASPGDNAGGDAAVASGPRPVRMLISKLYIDAPVIEMGFEPDTNIPDVPDRADQVAWYTFSATPALNNNAVFSGHVDWQTREGDPIPGVFYRLRELQIGDTISVALEDGQTADYRVTGNVAAAYDDPNVIRAMGPVTRDVITLVTCGGSWVKDRSKENGGNYTHRIVVRAERVADSAVSAES